MAALPPAAQLNDAAVAEVQKQADELTLADESLMHYEETLRQVGQIEGIEFTRRVADVAVAQIFESLRNSGKYKGLPYRDAEGNTRRVASLDEFCEVKLRRSYRRCLDLSQNLRSLGPELYEASEHLGLRNIDYKALRALPGDEQAVIKAAIEENKPREDLIDLIQEMAVRHHQERTARQATIDEQDATIKAKDAVIETKAAKIAELDARNQRVRTLPPNQMAREIRFELEGYAIAVECGIVNQLVPAIAALKAQLGTAADAYLRGVLGNIETRLAEAREAHDIEDGDPTEWARHLEDHPDQVPEWARPLIEG